MPTSLLRTFHLNVSATGGSLSLSVVFVLISNLSMSSSQGTLLPFLLELLHTHQVIIKRLPSSCRGTRKLEEGWVTQGTGRGQVCACVEADSITSSRSIHACIYIHMVKHRVVNQ